MSKNSKGSSKFGLRAAFLMTFERTIWPPTSISTFGDSTFDSWNFLMFLTPQHTACKTTSCYSTSQSHCTNTTGSKTMDLIFCYKIVFGIVNVSFSSFSKFSTVTSTRGHQYKLYKSHCSLSTRSRFFAERVINVWNCLPPSVDYSTLATFRRSIDGIDFTSSLKCDTDWVLSDTIGQLCVLLFLSFIFF